MFREVEGPMIPLREVEHSLDGLYPGRQILN